LKVEAWPAGLQALYFLCREQLHGILSHRQTTINEYSCGHLRDAAAITTTMFQLCSPESWPSTGTHQQIVAYLSGNGMFQHLSGILASSLPPHAREEPCFGEVIAAHMLNWYISCTESLSTSQLRAHSPWALLVVPRLLQRCSVLPKITGMTCTALDALYVLTPTELVQRLAELDLRGSATATLWRRNIAHCALQLLATLNQGLAVDRLALNARQALAFLQTSRVLVHLLPAAVRRALNTVMVRVSDHQKAVPTISSALCYIAEDAMDEGQLDDAGAWYFPWLQPKNNSSVHANCHRHNTEPEKIEFPVPLAGDEVISQLASSGVFESATGANELSCWLAMVLAICQSDKLIRDKIRTGWSNASCGLIGQLWTHGVKAAASAERLQADDTAPAWRLPKEVPEWLVPLMVLCCIYSQYVSTASDAAVFGDKVCTCAGFVLHPASSCANQWSIHLFISLVAIATFASCVVELS
jgi:hypothetical protein